MAEVSPFNGIRYNKKFAKDISTVICPPHDVIPPTLQNDLYHRSEYNFVRIEYGREYPQDIPAENRYSRAAATMQRWLATGVLKADEQPSIYIHDYQFTRKGKNYKRRGIIARVGLVEWSERIVFPHEGTLSRSKNDRLNILWSCQANTSPILAMFQDSTRKILPLLSNEAKKKPAVKIGGADGESHTLWVINEPNIIRDLHSAFATQPLYIADGHHRYEKRSDV